MKKLRKQKNIGVLKANFNKVTQMNRGKILIIKNLTPKQ